MKAEKFQRFTRGRIQHVYPAPTKERIVEEIESDSISVKDAMRKYEITRPTLKKWIRTYGKGQTIPSPMQQLTVLQQRQIITEIQTGNITHLEALKKYKISESTLYYWKRKYSTDIVMAKPTGNMKKNEKLNHDLTEFQQIEDLKLKIIALETMIDIAEKEFDIPIRKKYGSKQ